MGLYVYLYGLISLCNILLVNQLVTDDNYNKYIMHIAIILQTIISIIIINDDDRYINQLTFNCYFLKKIIMEKDKKILNYMKMNQKINIVGDNNNNNNNDNENCNKKKFDQNQKKFDEEEEIIAPIISDKKNN